MNIEKTNRIVMLPTNGAGDVDYAYIEYDLQNIEAVEREGFELIEGWEFKPFSLVPAQQSPVVAVTELNGSDDNILIPRGLIGAACSAIDKKRDAGKLLAELRRYTTGDLSKPPRITEQDAREIAKSVFNVIQIHESVVNAWFEGEGRDLLNKLNHPVSTNHAT